MPDRRKWFLLLLVFVLTGVGVGVVRWYSNTIVLAWVEVVPHDGTLVSGGMENLKHSLATDTITGVFYAGVQYRYLLPFQSSLPESVMLELQSANASVQWFDVNPDSLFLRAWSNSYATMLSSMPNHLIDSMSNVAEWSLRLRTLAVVKSGKERTQLLAEMDAGLDASTNGKYTLLRKRFARQLLHAANREMAFNPGKKWVILVDIELYPYVKEALVAAKKYRFEE